MADLPVPGLRAEPALPCWRSGPINRDRRQRDQMLRSDGVEGRLGLPLRRVPAASEMELEQPLLQVPGDPDKRPVPIYGF